ncbi:hypothetical protein HRG_014632 [Hirsutella rhossiliensis]
MKRNSSKICSRCIGRDRKKALDEPYFFSAANNLDFGKCVALNTNIAVTLSTSFAMLAGSLKSSQSYLKS